MKLNALQQKLLATYADSEYAHIQRAEDLRDCHDSLLRFLFAELDDDCYAESVSSETPVLIVATQRLARVIEQVAQLNLALIGK